MMKECIWLLALALSYPMYGQEKSGDQRMDFETYDPPSTLKVPEHIITKARFPFIDVHNHQWDMTTQQSLESLIAEMEKLNMAVMVNLSGRGYKRGPDHLEKSISAIQKYHPKRFILFTNVDFSAIDDPEWQERTLRQLEEDVKRGASGLKIYKSQGMDMRDKKGNRVRMDDTRIDPIWDKCGALGIPVLIHAADPKSFWDPADATNERWLELKTHPERKRSDTNPAPWEQIIQEQHNVFKKHPSTKFINAHMGWFANDLSRLGELLDEMPNMYVEIGAVIAELGRQPRTAREFMMKYQDRVMFGKDTWAPSEYTTYFRVLETADEYFPYHKRYHAFWRMYGLELPDEVLKKIYYKNALKVIPGIDASQFPK
jgi:predicted TIM-barrel fold metal-dependent hydrolase